MQSSTTPAGYLFRLPLVILLGGACFGLVLCGGGCPAPSASSDQPATLAADGQAEVDSPGTVDAPPLAPVPDVVIPAGHAAAKKTPPAWVDNVRFAVEPTEGERDLLVHAYAYTLDGSAVPQGQYRWVFDTTLEKGNESTHAEVWYTFSNGGLHTVQLSILAMGTLVPIGCVAPTGEVKPIAEVRVSPTIAGSVRDAAGQALAGVAVNDATGRTAVSDSQGVFVLAVPYGWTGTLTPSGDGLAFDPSSRAYTQVQADETGADFAATSAGQAPVADDVTVQTSQGTPVTATLTGSNPDGEPLTYVIDSVPGHGGLTDAGNGAAIGASQLPYTLSAGGQQVQYVPAAEFSGSDAFTFSVRDTSHDSSPASVGVTVAPENSPPTANPQSVTTPVNTDKAITLTGSDPDLDPLTFAVQSSPAHGTLSGSAPNVTYTPASGYTGADNFTFVANDGSAQSAPATISIMVGGWTPPIGIPAPPFGINETHLMYAGHTWDYGNGPEPYRNAGNGPYTHYIDNTAGAATDTNNTYGSPAKPRVTIPDNLPAGGVVEVHGGPYTYTAGGVIPLGGAGTSQQPIFIRGANAGSKPMFSKPLEVHGQYVIIENIDLNAWSVSNDCGIWFGGGRHHAALRNSEVHNGPQATTSAVALVGSSSTSKVQNVVIYNNVIHDNGDWQATYDQDHHGIGVSSYVDTVWVLNNEMYHNSGDGIQINGDNASTHHIYVGYNTSWQNKQTGFWSKYASDVIFSQNTAHSHVPSDSSPGAGMGWQYGPDRIWFIYNHLYNNTDGITGPSAGSAGAPAYIIGNIIHDCSELGINLWNNRSIYVVNNTIARCGSGISISGSEALYVVNNILANMTASGFAHLVVDGSMATNSRAQYNLFYQSGGTVDIDWSWDTNWSVATFQSQVSTAIGNIQQAPLFVNETGNDFHLQASSAAVNAGTATGLAQQVYSEFQTRYGVSIAVGFDGVPRPAGSGYDMGAYER